VALGEASHDAGFSEAEQLEDYIDGGAGNAATLAQAVFCTTSESLEENRQLIEWMHTRNSALGSRRKVRLYGIDLTGMRNGEFPAARLAIDRALATLSEIQREALTTAIEDLVSLLERRRLDSPALPSPSRYENALRNAIAARRLTACFRQARVDTAATPVDLRESLTVRDVAMADNVKWVLEREGRGGRILVFAHNFHVKKGPAGKIPVPVLPGRLGIGAE
jgi:erythromycin esterase